MQLINSYKFVKVVLDEIFEIFIIYIVALEMIKLTKITIHLFVIDQVLCKTTQLVMF